MNFRIFLIASCVLTILVSLAASGPVFAQNSKAAVTPPAQARAAFTGYKGVMIGTPMADVRLKLGEPKEKSDVQDYFVVSEGETAQILYDTDKTVKVISTSYFGAAMTPPAAKDLFGTDVEAAANGAINKVVKYPKAGYWISYIRTGGDDPMVMITIQKMQQEQQ